MTFTLIQRLSNVTNGTIDDATLLHPAYRALMVEDVKALRAAEQTIVELDAEIATAKRRVADKEGMSCTSATELSQNLQTVLSNTDKSAHWYTAHDRPESPTIGAAMELPQIKALADTLERIAHVADFYGVEANAEDQGADTLAYAHKTISNLARAALAELKQS